MLRSLFLLAAVLVALIACVRPVTSNPHNKVIRVKANESIQKAINSASPGDKIIVEAGTYNEQLTITTKCLTLIGHNAIINPPTTPVTNTCSDLTGPGKQAGICITGSNVKLQDLSQFDGEHRKVTSVGKYIEDTSVSGFTVTGFDGLNIAIVGSKDATVFDNTVGSASSYGILTVGSKNSKINHNIVLSTPGLFPFYFVGICMDDVSTVTVSNNDISGYFIGLCVQTDGANIYSNKVHDVCVGSFVDPKNKGAKLINNSFKGTIPSGCPAFPEYRKYSSGITISGATNTIVKGNRFSGLKNQGAAAGIAVLDNVDDTTKQVTAIASGIIVEKNFFNDNDLDVFVASTGGGNVVRKNQCSTSSPAGLCK